jgi:hypothetical protein
MNPVIAMNPIPLSLCGILSGVATVRRTSNMMATTAKGLSFMAIEPPMMKAAMFRF